MENKLTTDEENLAKETALEVKAKARTLDENKRPAFLETVFEIMTKPDAVGASGGELLPAKLKTEERKPWRGNISEYHRPADKK